jgi:putative addiction module component (TIGR02574 family)
MSSVDLTQIKRLSVSERMTLVEDIWDSIAEDSAQVEVPDWHRKVIIERLAKYRDQPEVGTPWPEVRKRIEQGQ